MEAETTFYPEESEGQAPSSRDAVQKLKSKMTLDLFASGSGAVPSARAKQAKLGGVLASPDLQMLKLASPELERMIIQQNGMVTTTPTPTQFLCPKFVTEEQEAYARGFVDALNELHKQQPPVPGAAPGQGPAPVPAASQAAPTTTAAELPFTSFTAPVSTAFPTTAVTTSSSSQPQGFPAPAAAPMASLPEPSTLQLKQEEPQTVPCLGITPPISPINMESQEVIKLERKRARNRVAARKCRTRKLERISRLEDRVSELKGQNSDLTTTANSLRDQVCRLKQQIMEHVNSGCQVMLSQNLL